MTHLRLANYNYKKLTSEKKNTSGNLGIFGIPHSFAQLVASNSIIIFYRTIRQKLSDLIQLHHIHCLQLA